MMHGISIQVSVGEYLSESLEQPLVYISASSNIPLEIIIPVVAGSVVVVMILSLFIICCVVLYNRKKLRKIEMELMGVTFSKDSRILLGKCT